MRVIAGKAKGRQLCSVRGPGTRPMTNRAKAALFSILGSHVSGSDFLDLFAGTGQVGIEALSRGAAHTVFVEQGPAALRAIQTNLETTNLEAGAEVVRADVFKYLAQSPKPYDYIFIAPPQYRGWWIQALQLIDAQPGWLYEDGWAIVQINPTEYEPVALENLVLFDQRTYGSVMLCFYAHPYDEDREGGEDTV
ncbi:MAG: 16S rRNA (guanine(966)-N(2))-methyltransferase RsmD [Anaerolineae bacterium]|nr:16S rRNA (guanine(966)-N(2))-methyltransferase RsmD [Anaerolineae bacterium]